ncbi:MAG TPA: bifunctional diguanylate cyclase/phosphodiesterase [Acidobacteriaceae bacterium]|nr:bifunctional diguanylate cyclase/phosphodiesterase [Acidobacteriaceae bacterium]
MPGIGGPLRGETLGAMTDDGVQSGRSLKELLAIEEALRVSEQRYRVAFETSLDAIGITRIDDGMFVDVNRQFFTMVGYTREELVGQTSLQGCTWTDSEGESHPAEFIDVTGRSTLDIGLWEDSAQRAELMAILRREAVCRGFEARFRRKNGELFWVQLSASVIQLDGVDCVLFVTRDITAAKAAEEEIRNLSLYDDVTCLPNRRHLLERLQARQQTAMGNAKSALLSISLDHFRTFNDSFGGAAGELLLREMARRVETCVRECDTVARSGGAEFAVLLGHLCGSREDAAGQAQEIARRVLERISEPCGVAGQICHCTASIGITIFQERGLSGEQIVQQSDIAVDHARVAGRNTIRFFAPALQTAISERVAMEADLRRAMTSNELMLCYQPQMDRGNLTGAEALVRWRHPTRGLLLPSAFIPVAEEAGLIVPLGEWVLENACRQLARWSHSGKMRDLTLAVNISAWQFRQPDFTEKVLDTIRRHQVDPQRLELELTESSLVEDVDAVVMRMGELKAHGLRFSVDDFGVGYSSLSYLQRLPLDKLKIDMQFVRNLLIDPGSRAIARAIISLSQALGLRVIAEGVESEQQRKHLSELGCDAWQGFLCSQPVVAEEFEELVAGEKAQRLPARTGSR